MSKHMFTSFEIKLMKRLLKKASVYVGLTSPNPLVAAAVVRDGTILSEGVHRMFGDDHAEYSAISNCTGDLNGATLYVTLEPCTHWGKKPPCTDIIVGSGIQRVVYSLRDPNPDVRASDKHILQENGIQVDSGLCEEEALLVNEVYYKNRLFQKPFVTMKVAMSLDGKIACANGESCYITNEMSRKQVHRMRREVDAVLVGVGTVVMDDPQLTVRYRLLRDGYSHPKLVILDTQLRTPLSSKLFECHDPDSIIIMTAETAIEAHPLSKKARLYSVPNTENGLSWPHIMDHLFEDGICHLLIEGGASVFTTAVQSGIVDRYDVFIGSKLLLEENAPGPFKGGAISGLSDSLSYTSIQSKQLGDNLWVSTRFYSFDDWRARLQ